MGEGRMMGKLARVTALAAFAVLVPTAAGADEAVAPRLTFHGFGTLGVVHSDEDQADFVANQFSAPDGAGFTRAWSPEVDSRLGLQVTASLTPRLTGVLQLKCWCARRHRMDRCVFRDQGPGPVRTSPGL
jgi:hypothetical protein